MQAFHSAREAKELVISKIVAQAEHDRVPLSEVERKMLYFTESGWTLPDIEQVQEDFDRDYDQDEYEKKVAGLIRKADRHLKKGHLHIAANHPRWPKSRQSHLQIHR
jgi:hypothetical protein